ncbi:hypothetical protein [Hydrogenophaga sp. H7]|uniref:hypothetical protein n=1 Tax=Hydrogenophaga sp. H7 TaxID=1882399 RepID=UPI00117B9E0F|nr:hypothetical protein [Hydrogenophaga sp. H7]
MRNLALAIVISFIVSAASAQQTKTASPAKASSISMERFEGQSVITDLGFNVKLNGNSTLKREWFVVRDDSAPISINGAAGVQVVYKSGDKYSSGQYQYKVDYKLEPREPITAFQIRIHVLDVFGRLLHTLSDTELFDFSESQGFDGTWRIGSENDASEAFASVAYISQVRTAKGRVYEVDRAAVFDQVRKVARRIAEVDLEPKSETLQKQ